MNLNKKYDFYKNALYFLIANAVLLVASIVIVSIFGFNAETSLSWGRLVFQCSISAFISLLIVAIYVGLRYDWSKALTSVLISFHNILLSLALVGLIRVPVNETLVLGIALVVAISTLLTLLLTNKAKDVNFKKADYSEVVKDATIKSLKQIVAFTAVAVLLNFLGLIIKSADMFGFARLFFVMIIVTLYGAVIISMPTWCFIASKMKKVKRAKVDAEVENQKVVQAASLDENTQN